MRTVVQTSLINSGVTQHMRSVSRLVCQTKGEAQRERIMRDFQHSSRLFYCWGELDSEFCHSVRVSECIAAVV